MLNNILIVTIGCLVAFGIRDLIGVIINVFFAYKKAKEIYGVKDLRRDEDK